jgi:hypothetical protein
VICFALPDNARFTSNAAVNDARVQIANLYNAALPTFRKDEDRIEFPAKIGRASTDHWTNFKADFARVQHGRCGYCELPVIGAQHGDVEHYRPKGMVEIFDPSRQGAEKQNLSNVEGRAALRRIGTGYWWHAYAWDNYLLSCAICNQSWKKNFFPIAGDPTLRQRPAEGVAEDALLLYPFGTDDPAEHFSYEPDGRIRGLTAKGVATIETVGLWRPSLVEKRKQVLDTLYRLISEMLHPDSPDMLVRSHARTILAQGSLKSNTFPGMTRIVFQQIAGMSWGELEAMVTNFDNGAAVDHRGGGMAGDVAA